MKEYKTYNQQLGILRKRGMKIATDGKAKRFLEQENYYNVINGYKDLFLIKNSNGHPVEPEEYKVGTNFKELKNLYLFDRDLRFVLLKNLLIFENSIKTQIAHEFSRRYPRKNSYLELSNFVDDPKIVLKQISTISKIISDKVGKEPSLSHYIDKHGEIPLWVLTNYLTIGNISYFYEILTDSLKNEISRFYSQKFCRQYGREIRITSEDLSAIIKMTNIVRNKCAHEERVYNSNLKNIRSSSIIKYFGLKNINNKKLVMTFILLKVVLDKKQFCSFYSEIMKLFKNYEVKFHTISFNDILRERGIDLIELEKLK